MVTTPVAMLLHASPSECWRHFEAVGVAPAIVLHFGAAGTLTVRIYFVGILWLALVADFLYKLIRLSVWMNEFNRWGILASDNQYAAA